MTSFVRALKLFALGLPLALTGCVTSQVYGYRNPQFVQTHYAQMAVYVNSYDLGLRQRLETSMCQAMAPTPCTPVGALIFPGSVQSFGEMLDQLSEKGQPNVLVIQINQDHADRTYAGTVSSSQSQYSGYGSAQGQSVGTYTPNGWTSNYTGTSQVHGYGSSSSLSAPIYAYSRTSEGDVELVDTHNRLTAWRARLDTNGQSLSALSNSSFEHEQAAKLAQALHTSGLF